MKFEIYSIKGKDLKIPTPESYRDCITLVKSDRYRISGKIESFFSIVTKVMLPFKSSVLFWFRLSQYKGFLYPFCKYMYARASRRDMIQLPSRTKVGYGLYIGHRICMVINGGTVIGNNVNLSQFLNIGTNKRTPAIIGDNVYIGPQVCILEDVTIGNNATVGAGAVVTKDIPENATAVGVPAKILNTDHPAQYINNPYPLP